MVDGLLNGLRKKELMRELLRWIGRGRRMIG